MITKVTTRGQISIPSKIRKTFNIESESKVEWVIEGDVIKVIPIPKDPILAFRGKGRKLYTHEQLMIERKLDRRNESERDK